MGGKFKGKVALATGAGARMGLATAQAFARAVANVVLVDINEESVVTAAKASTKEGAKALTVRCDVASETDVETMMARTVETFGRPDCAFNNAGIISPHHDTADLPDAEWDRVVSINLRGTWYCMKHELKRMLSQESSAIVNASSVGGLNGVAGLPAYIASKYGIIGLTKSAAALWLCSSEASPVLGHALSVDGGYSAQYPTLFSTGDSPCLRPLQPHARHLAILLPPWPNIPTRFFSGMCGSVPNSHRATEV